MGLLSLIVRIGADGRQFSAGLKQAEVQSAKFAENIKHHIAGAFTAGAVISFGHALIETAKRVKQLSEQYEIGTDKIQEYDIAGLHSGQTADEVLKKLDKLEAFRADASKGDLKKIDTLKRLGISYEEIIDPVLKVTDLFEKMDATASRSDFLEVFGTKAGGKMLAVLKEMQAIAEHGHQPIISEEDIKNIFEAEHALAMLKKQLMAIGAVPVSGFAGLFSGQGGFGDFLKNLAKFSSTGIIGPWLKLLSPKLFEQPKGSEEPEATVGPDLGAAERLEALAVEREKVRKQIEEDRVKLLEKLFQLQMKVATVEEQRAMLQGKLGQLSRKEEFLLNFGGVGASLLLPKLQAEMLDRISELQALDSKQRQPRAIDLTPLERLGGRAGPADINSVKPEVRQSNLYLQHIDQNTKALQQTIKSGGSIIIP